MPDADDVEYREADGIAHLTLNRPAKLNAFGPNSFRLLGEHVTRFAGSPSAGVAILHGNGDSFAAGADIEHYVGLSVLEYADFMRTGHATQQMQAIGAVLYGTDDAREGIAAFVAKRKPRFGGH